MATTEHTLKVEFQARYYTLGNLNANTRNIWFVLHGYGQLAQYFIKKFNTLEKEGIYVIAPEGLSKFYLEDVTSRSRSGNQRVGATWMTRENRQTDIVNYVNYLNQVYDRCVPKNFNGMITVFGFSQGAATAARWVIDKHIKFDQLITWCGILPEDMNFEAASEIFKNKKVMVVMGKSDPYLSDEKLNEMTTIHERLKIKPTLIAFEGGHEIPHDVLHTLVE
ncbi:MAG: serine hydrolase family protein [Cyclobacteriaceae bacterium]|nr:serine hydrolase family protein [Cyclobacteriaceae bacterium]